MREKTTLKWSTGWTSVIINWVVEQAIKTQNKHSTGYTKLRKNKLHHLVVLKIENILSFCHDEILKADFYFFFKLQKVQESNTCMKYMYTVHIYILQHKSAYCVWWWTWRVFTITQKRTLTYKLSVPRVLHFMLPKHPVKLREISDAALKRNEICWLCELCCELGVVSVSLSRWTAVNPSDDDRGEAWLGTGSSP